jgi:hypothetical protein
MLWNKLIGGKVAGAVLDGYSIDYGAVARAANVASINVDYPSDIASGDLLIIFGIKLGSSGVYVTATGFTDTLSSDVYISLTKTADGTETGSVTCDSGNPASDFSLIMLRVRANVPIEIKGKSTYYGTSGTLTPSNTVGNGYDLNILAFAQPQLSRTASVSSPTPTGTIATNAYLWCWYWDDNQSNISITTSSGGGHNLITINEA